MNKRFLMSAAIGAGVYYAFNGGLNADYRPSTLLGKVMGTTMSGKQALLIDAAVNGVVVILVKRYLN